MRKMKGFRNLSAWMLIIVFSLGTICASLAEDPITYSDLQTIEIIACPDETVNTLIDVNIRTNAGESVVEDDLEECTIQTGNISNENINGVAVEIKSEDVTVNVTTGSINQDDENPALWVASEGKDSVIIAVSEAVTSDGDGIEIRNEGGIINLTVDSVDAAGTGIDVENQMALVGVEGIDYSDLYNAAQGKIAIVEGRDLEFWDESTNSMYIGEYMDGSYVCRVKHYAAIDGTSTVTVNKDVTVNYDGSMDSGIYTNSTVDNNDINIIVDGNVTAVSTTNSKGINAHSSANESTTEIHVAGDVTAKSTAENGATAAIAVYAESGNYKDASGYVNVTVDGKAIANVMSDSSVAEEYAVYADSNGKDSSTRVTIGEGAEGTVYESAVNGSKTDVVILDGGVVTDKQNPAIQLYEENAVINTTVKGDVEAKSGDAIRTRVYGKDGETNLTINGSVSAQNTNNATALSAEIHDQGTLNATISGESLSAVTENEDAYTRGIKVDNCGGDANIQIDAAITSAGGHSTGLSVTSYAGNNFQYFIEEDAQPVDVSGLTSNGEYWDIQIDGKTYTVYEFTDNDSEWYYSYVLIDGAYYDYDGEQIYDKGATNITVTGDVSATEYGASLELASEQTASIIVDGTLSGGEAAVVLRGKDSVVGDNANLAVWKLETDSEEENAALIMGGEFDEDTEEWTFTPNEKAEEAVQYIIKIMKDWTSALSATGTETVTVGKGDDKTEYQTARQGEDVVLKLALGAGEELEGVYYDEDATEDDLMTFANEKLSKDEDGNILVKMLRGGGMMLGLKLMHKHNLTAFKANEPTCDKDGNSAYWYCPDCGKYFSDAEGKNEIAKDSWIKKATGHKLEHVAAVVPTCDKDGNKEYWYCSVCKKYFSDAEGKNEVDYASLVLKAGHKLTKVEAKAPTCDKDGNIAYWYCPECGKYFSDADGKNEISKEDTIKKATGHQLTKVEAKEPTEKADGNTAYWYCPECGKFFSDAEGKNEIAKDSWLIPSTGAADTSETAVSYTVAAPILTIKGLNPDDNIEIRFYRSGNFVVQMANGDKEKGTYAFENDQLVLTCESGRVTVNADEAFTYTSVMSGQAYQFRMSQAEIDTLKGN